MALLTPPSSFPDWAVQNQVDDVSGQNNVLVPPPEKQQYGWSRLEFPVRQWFNWLFRTINDWIQYLAQQAGLKVTTDGTGSTAAFNTVTGGLCIIWVQDKGSGGAANFFNGICYVPPSPVSPVSFNTIATSSTLTVSSISTSGNVTVTGGVGPYVVVGLTNAQ